LSDLQGPYWVLVRTQPGKENWARENIERQGCRDLYLPQFSEVVLAGRKEKHREVRIRPLFPSYLFVQVETQWRFLLGTFGVSGIVQVGQAPAIVPPQVVEALKKREGMDGLIVLPRPKIVRYRLHQSVKVVDGIFEGHVGIFEGSPAPDRVKVLLDILGRKTSVLLGEESIVPSV
jgi:transcriptional antiterminator RfaH